MPNKTRTIAATEFRPDGGERLVANNGDIQASSKKDMFAQQQKLMAAASSGQVRTQAELETQEATHKMLVAAAFNDPAAHRLLGERMADELYDTGNRKGWMRRFLARINLKQGEMPRFPVRMKNVQAFVATGPTRTEAQIVRDRYLRPPEFQVWSRPFIPQNDLNQSPSDVLSEKFTEAVEAFMVQEDRLWYNMASQAIGLANNQAISTGSFTPALMMGAHDQVNRWGLKTVNMLMASDLITDIVADTTFTTAMEPVSRHELVMTGQIAILFGMNILSEQYRHPEHKVLSRGEYIAVSDPLYHGAYSDRGGINSEPTNMTTEGVIGRGWAMEESLSMVVANDRSVAFGRRT